MNRQEAFLSRVRQALRGEGRRSADSGAVQPPPPLLDSQPGPTVNTDDLIRQLQTELTAVGGQVIRVPSASAATAYIDAFTREHNLRRVVRWSSELLTQLEIDATLEANGIEIHVPPAHMTTVSADDRQMMRQHVAQAELGISGVTYVIAETGTLALAAQAGQMRGVSLLPPVHIAIALADQLVPTMADCLLRLQDAGDDLQHNLTSCISFITGPSRTGDIELNLTVGVHGPGELHLVIVDSV